MKSTEEIVYMLENAPVAFFHGDPAGNLLSVNHKAAELTGFSREELMTMNIAGLLSDSSKEHVTRISAAGSSAGQDRFDSSVRRKSGEDTAVEFLVSGLPGGYFQCFAVDIEDRKKAERTLLESEARLSELNATKDKFFSIIAHDLRSPFYTITGFCSVLSEQVKAKEYEGVDEYAEIILKTSQKAMDLLKNLLEWAISQTGRMVFNPENLDLYMLLHETVDLLRDSARQKSITISLDAPIDLPVFVDRSMINSVIRNLLSNAIKFSRPSGAISVAARPDGDNILVTVADNGVGMNEKALSRLFRIDEAHATTGTRKEEGTGLGLILCKEFVDKHKGRIWAESEPDKGSTFYFTLPLNRD